MFFKLTDEHIMIQTMVREFSRKEIAPTAADRDKTKEFPKEILKKMGGLGLMGMMVPLNTAVKELILSAISLPFLKLLIHALQPL